MPCATITFTDITQPALDLFTLLTASTTPGYSVAGGQLDTKTLLSRVSYLSIQASPSNASNQNVLKGDKDTGSAGTRQGKELAPGIIDTIQGIENAGFLNQIYLRATQNALKANVEWYYS